MKIFLAIALTLASPISIQGTATGTNNTSLQTTATSLELGPTPKATRTLPDFVRGVGAGFTDFVSGFANAVEHPIKTVKGVATIIRHPVRTLNATRVGFHAECAREGTAECSGKAAFNLATFGTVPVSAVVFGVKTAALAQVAQSIGSAGLAGKIGNIAKK